MLSHSLFCALPFLLKVAHNFGVEAIGCGSLKNGFGLAGMTPAETNELADTVSTCVDVANQAAALFPERTPSCEAVITGIECPFQMKRLWLIPVDVTAIVVSVYVDRQKPCLRRRGGSRRYRENEQRRREYQAFHDDLSIFDQNNFYYQPPYLGRQKGS